MWHGHELYSPLESSAVPAAKRDSGLQQQQQQDEDAGGRVIRWRHYQALVKLMQVIHLTADAISDWDCFVDSVEQHVHHFSRLHSSMASGTNTASGSTTQTGKSSGRAHLKVADVVADAELGSAEIDKIFAAIERMKLYTIFLSDDALVKLMTSLVALSMNNLAVSATSLTGSSGGGDDDDGSGSGGGGDEANAVAGQSSIPEMIQVSAAFSTGRGAAAAGGGGAQHGSSLVRIRPESSSAGLAYMVEGVGNGTIGFSLQAVIEITKLNSFRISVVWQMVISHLRMIAASKVRLRSLPSVSHFYRSKALYYCSCLFYLYCNVDYYFHRHCLGVC